MKAVTYSKVRETLQKWKVPVIKLANKLISMKTDVRVLFDEYPWLVQFHDSVSNPENSIKTKKSAVSQNLADNNAPIRKNNL